MNASTSDFIIGPIGVDSSDVSDTETCESSTSSDAETFSESSDEDELNTSFFVLSDEDSPFSSPSKEPSATDRHTGPLINHCIQVLLAI